MPTIAGFDRLDKQFVLPSQLWAKVRTYRDWGFAVFKRNNTGSQIQSPRHPMAFSFRTRYSDRLFLPPLHIHDEQIHPVEALDHALYFQDAQIDTSVLHSPKQPAARFMDVQAAQNIVDGNLPCCKRELRGMHANRDTSIYLA